MPLHPGQIKYIEDTFRLGTKINVLNPSNRYGKTTIAACLHIHAHFYKLGVPTGNRAAWVKAAYRTANVAPRSSLIEPVFNYIDQIMSSAFPITLPDGRIVTNKCQIEWFYLKEQTRESPVHKQFFAFNSYIEHRTLGATAADSLEGKPFGLITYDEGGRSLHLQDEVSGTILARLFDWNGQFHLISTPDQGSPSILYHYELFERGMAGNYAETKTYAMEGTLKDNIFFPPAQIAEQYDLYKNDPLGPQVLEGKFVFGGDNIFPPDDILQAQDESLNDGVRREDGHKYTISIDSAMGSDEMVYTVLDVTEKPFRLVKMVAAKGNSKSPQVHLNDFLDLYDAYKSETTKVKIMLETWNGESARFYQDLPYELQSVTKCYGSWQPGRGFNTNKNLERPKTQSIKKADILVALRKLLSAHELKIPKNNAPLIQQLSIYKEKDDNLPTDRVISLALGAWLASEASTFPAPLQFKDWD
jgi:hypothetical protein